MLSQKEGKGILVRVAKLLRLSILSISCQADCDLLFKATRLECHTPI